MTYEEIVRRFDAKQTGSGYQACCPAHEDDTASLSISRGVKGTLITCHAGCDINAIVRAKGLTLKDLFYTSNGNHTSGGTQPSSVVATYLFRDAKGTLRYRKQRHADKRFFFARPDGNGGWITSAKQNGGKNVMADVTRLPYRLNELADHTTIFIAEGRRPPLRARPCGDDE